ncbi:hypothetical protein ACJJTC_015598 [Scirpophaga incertulas]
MTRPTELLSLTSDPAESTNLVNKYFSEIGAKLAGDILMKCKPGAHYTPINVSDPQCDSMVLLDTDVAEVSAVINSLKNDSAPVKGIGKLQCDQFRHVQIMIMLLKLLTLSPTSETTRGGTGSGRGLGIGIRTAATEGQSVKATVAARTMSSVATEAAATTAAATAPVAAQPTIVVTPTALA